jgi:hypothetical protein
MLGDLLESALSRVGVTKDRVERWLGRPCGCAERQEKLNQLGYWAKSVLAGKSKHPEKYLDGIVGLPTEHRPANPEGEG